VRKQPRGQSDNTLLSLKLNLDAASLKKQETVEVSRCAARKPN
jgi:hypothetical protein